MAGNEKSKKDMHVALLYGGWSVEREVSLDSGIACAEALEEAGYKNVELVDVAPTIATALEAKRPDVAFNALHGKWGEDGCIQAILEVLRIPYTHSGVRASAVAMHKEIAKSLFKDVGIPTARSKIVQLDEELVDHPLMVPYVIKPVAEGSSVGVRIVREDGNEPLSSLFSRAEYGADVMVEAYVQGRELTCAVMGGVALGVIDIVSMGDFYNYDSKYVPGGSEHILPADLPSDVYRKIQNYSLKAHNALGCKGVTRSDFRYDDSGGEGGELIIMEINTQPGMTGTSLVPEIAAHAGHSYPELVDWMVRDASCDR
jgi:D-alanine-D-alanine ligase